MRRLPRDDRIRLLVSVRPVPPRESFTVVIPASISRRPSITASDGSGGGIPAQAAATAQRINQLAAEIRLPLESLRASIQAAGSQPGANLRAAFAHCDQLERKLGELISIQPPTPPLLPVWRRKVAVAEIHAAVETALRRLVRPAAMDVLWDGADDPNSFVYADLELISQTLLYLIGLSLQATPPGGCVLVRLQTERARETIRWSVIDQGRGFRQSELEQMLSAEPPAEGTSVVGLSACREVAALHHSALKLHSRVNSGTEISFETCRYGPREFASSWTAWRLAQRGPVSDRPAAAGPSPLTARSMDFPQRLRVDEAPARLTLLRTNETPRYPNVISIGTVVVGATVALSAANQFDRLLQQQLHRFDFAFRVGPRRWVWGLDADQPAARDRIHLMQQAAAANIPGIRADWSPLGTIPVQPGPTRKRLSDVLAHQALSESTPPTVTNKDEVRLGTAPLQCSAETELRLKMELQQLSDLLTRQTMRLRQQTQRIAEPRHG